MTTAPEQARVACDAMAPVYDDFTAGYQAESWTSTVVEKLQAHGAQEGGSLLDLGCGTGKSMAPMLGRGWRVAGVDVSARMLAVARERVGDEVPLFHRDVRDLGKLDDGPGFDVAWSLNDGFNYLLSTPDLDAALAGVARNLQGGGLLAIDLTALAGFRRAFGGADDSDRGDLPFKWTSISETDLPPGAVWEATFEVGDAPTHLHRMRHFTEEAMVLALKRAGFQVLDISGWHETRGELQPLVEEIHDRALYIAKLV